MSKSRQRVFLITGVSSGFGRAFAEAALSAGHVVIGTVRSEAAKAAFEQLQPDRAHGVVLDVTDFAKIDAAVAGVTERTGPVDVLVNNAGYGHEGTLEESSLEELLHQFNVNVFGAVAYYSGSKFALEGISESLAQEVRDFGIRVTAVAPGSFRTDWAGRSMVRTERSIADYDPVFDPVRAARQAKDGRQAGDPDKAAHVLLDLVEHPDPPVHLLLGSDALSVVRRKLSTMQTAIGAWEEVSRSTDFS
jgi:NAD(P)-dependent dehydrogenase (short-subunit alcohol dehydrogenase family)